MMSLPVWLTCPILITRGNLSLVQNYFSVQGGLCPGGSNKETPPYGDKQVAHILTECFLVYSKIESATLSGKYLHQTTGNSSDEIKLIRPLK